MSYQFENYQPEGYQPEDFQSEDYQSKDYQSDIKSPSEDKSKPSFSAVSVFVSGILGGAMAFVFLAYVFPQFPFKGPRFAIADTQKIIHDRAQTLGKQKLSKKALQEDQEDFIENLNAVLDFLSKKKNVILLKPESVLSPLPDYTAEIVDHIRLLEITGANPTFMNEHKAKSENESED